MTQSADTRTILAGLRPQPFGKTSANRILDPIVEPHWAGMRVLAAVDPSTSTLVDETGSEVVGQERIARALVAIAHADGVIVDGYLTKQIIRDEGTAPGPSAISIPKPSQVMNRMMFGSLRSRGQERAAALKAADEARRFAPDDTVTLIITDLLWLEGESLVDIPLLERRRQLGSLFDDSDVVRTGVYVRPPIHTWVGSWRAQGFTGLTFKAANARYSPGVATDEWALIGMPRH